MVLDVAEVVQDPEASAIETGVCGTVRLCLAQGGLKVSLEGCLQ